MTRLAFAALLALLVPVPAHAVPNEPLSREACRFWTPLQEQYPYDDGRNYAVLWSHPVYVGIENAVVTCTVQLGADTTHAGADSVVRSSASTQGVALLAPTTVTYDLAGYFSYCSQVTYASGRAYYWNAETGGWSTDPTVPCETLRPFGPPPQEAPGVVPALTREYGSPVVCPVVGEDVWLGGMLLADC